MDCKQIPNLLDLLHKVTKKKLTKTEKKKYIEEFKLKCEITHKMTLKIKNRTRCTMYSFNNVWWLLAEAPLECLEACVPWLKLTDSGLDELMNQILSLAPSKEKSDKLKMITTHISLDKNCNPLAYIARSNMKSYRIFFSKLLTPILTKWFVISSVKLKIDKSIGKPHPVPIHEDSLLTLNIYLF